MSTGGAEEVDGKSSSGAALGLGTGSSRLCFSQRRRNRRGLILQITPKSRSPI